MHGGQANGRCRVSPEGLDQCVLRRHRRHLAANRVYLLIIGDHPYMPAGKERGQTIVSLLEHGLLPGDVEQLFRGARTAAGPETRSASTGKNDRVSGWRCRSHWRRIAER